MCFRLVLQFAKRLFQEYEYDMMMLTVSNKNLWSSTSLNWQIRRNNQMPQNATIAHAIPRQTLNALWKVFMSMYPACTDQKKS